MKKLKVKLEYSFEVPDDTQIIQDPHHGLFIVNETHGVKSMPTIKGFKLDSVEFDENGEFDNSILSDDDHALSDFLYDNASLEKTTINLGKEKYQYKIKM